MPVTQAGGTSYSAHYEDGEAVYDGTVCGRIFRYNGSGPGYTEEGQLTMSSDGTEATKRSTYQNLGGGCGSCVDTLDRYILPD